MRSSMDLCAQRQSNDCCAMAIANAVELRCRVEDTTRCCRNHTPPGRLGALTMRSGRNAGQRLSKCCNQSIKESHETAVFCRKRRSLRPVTASLDGVSLVHKKWSIRPRSTSFDSTHSHTARARTASRAERALSEDRPKRDHCVCAHCALRCFGVEWLWRQLFEFESSLRPQSTIAHARAVRLPPLLQRSMRVPLRSQCACCQRCRSLTACVSIDCLCVSIDSAPHLASVLISFSSGSIETHRQDTASPGHPPHCQEQLLHRRCRSLRPWSRTECRCSGLADAVGRWSTVS